VRASIGVFDSGVGGLTVTKEIQRCLPDEEIVYLGDTARVPYGSKSRDTILKFSIENVLFLLKFNVKIVVVACNTSASLSLAILKRHFSVPIVGVIEPGAREAVEVTNNGRIGIIGTQATIQSGAYQQLIRRLAPSAKVYSQECPLFVPLVEEGWIDDPVTYEIASRYLGPLRNKQIDTLILGCTHYPLLKAVLKRIMPGVVLVDSAKETAIEVRKVLAAKGMLRKAPGLNGRCRFYVTDEPDRFVRIGRRFLARPIESVRRVNNNV
jgi:glutamate racemase